MNSRRLLPLIEKSCVLIIALLVLLPLAAFAQLIQASPPIADPSDDRFDGVKEIWTTPTLSGSNLKMAKPLTGYMNDYSTYTVQLLQIQWRFGDPIDLYVIKPKGVSKPPVILYLYNFSSDTDRFKDETFQAGATKDGFAAVGFVSALSGHRYHDRPMREWFISELQESLAASAHDVQMILNYLASRGDLDMDRVGMYASGSGASIGILTSAVDRRIKVLDTFNPWGDWPVWMAASPIVPEDERGEYLKPEFLKKAAVLDPVDWLPKIQAKKFRLQDESFDPNTPTAARQKLRTATPAGATLSTYKSTEELNTVIAQQMELAWIKHELLGLPN